MKDNSYRHLRMLVVVLCALIVMLSMALPAYAQDGRPGQLVFGGNYTLESGETLTGDLGIAGGNAVLEEGSTVRGDVLVAGGTLSVAGAVGGDIAMFGGVVTLQSTAVVDGDVVSFGGSFARQPGAVVRGDIREGIEFDLPGWRGFRVGPVVPAMPDLPQPTSPGQWLLNTFLWFVRNIALTLAIGALALVISLLWPRGTRLLGTTILEQPILAFLIGLLTWTVLSALGIVMVITICLIPVALVLVVAMLAIAVLSWVAAGWVVGNKLLSVFKVRNSTVVLEATAGTVLLTLLYFLLSIVPCLDFIYGMVVASVGAGAIVLTRFGTRPYVPGGRPAGPSGTPPALPPAPGPGEAAQKAIEGPQAIPLPGDTQQSAGTAEGRVGEDASYTAVEGGGAFRTGAELGLPDDT